MSEIMILRPLPPGAPNFIIKKLDLIDVPAELFLVLSSISNFIIIF